MDNILVYSCTLSDHWQIICQVLSTLWEQRLFLKPEKCKFEQKEVKYLGLVILKDHVAMDLTKVRRVTEWPTPMKVKEVQSFLGFVNFYRKLNEIMVKNSYPLPLVSDVLTHLRNAEFFTILDLQWGFNNMQIKEGDEWKAAFQTN